MSLNDVHGFNAMLARISSDFNELKLHIRRGDNKTVVTALSGDLMGIGYANDSATVGVAARAALTDLGVRLAARDAELAQVAEQRQAIERQRNELPAKRAELQQKRERVVRLENTVATLAEDLNALSNRAYAERMALISAKRNELNVLNAEVLTLAGQVADLEENFDFDDWD